MVCELDVRGKWKEPQATGIFPERVEVEGFVVSSLWRAGLYAESLSKGVGLKKSLPLQIGTNRWFKRCAKEPACATLLMPLELA